MKKQPKELQGQDTAIPWESYPALLCQAGQIIKAGHLVSVHDGNVAGVLLRDFGCNDTL